MLRARFGIGLILLVGLVMPAVLPGLPRPAVAQEGSGSGVGIYPVVVEINDALRNGEYLRTFTIVNREPVDLDLRFSPDGEIARWLTVHPSPDDLETTLNHIIVPAESDARLILKVNIPEQAANGEYSGGMLFQGTPAASAEGSSGVGVSIGIAADISITVTGEQNLSARILDVFVDDAEVDQPPVRLHLRLENDGNVVARPAIEWSIEDSEGNQVGSVDSSEHSVQPGFVNEIVLEWDSTDIIEGNYVGRIRVELADEVIDERKIEFEILPLGTLTRSGVLESLYIENEPQVGTVGKAVAMFRNTGKIDTHAVLVAELHVDDRLVDVVESQELVAEVGSRIFLEGFFDVQEAGEYRIVGVVRYDGKETDQHETSFRVESLAQERSTQPAEDIEALPATTGGSQSIGSWLERWWLPGTAILALLASAFAFAVGRGFSRSTHPADPALRTPGTPRRQD